MLWTLSCTVFCPSARLQALLNGSLKPWEVAVVEWSMIISSMLDRKKATHRRTLLGLRIEFCRTCRAKERSVNSHKLSNLLSSRLSTKRTQRPSFKGFQRFFIKTQKLQNWVVARSHSKLRRSLPQGPSIHRRAPKSWVTIQDWEASAIPCPSQS